MIEVKLDEKLKMFVMVLDGHVMMKNKKESTLHEKVAKWLKSQGR